MLRKIIIGGIILLMGLYINVNGVLAGKSCAGTGTNRLTGTAAVNCINSIGFEIDTNNFAPGGKQVGGVDITNSPSTEGTMKLLLGVIIKNLIVIFGVLSLLVMTIGAGYMIFHAGEESLLSRGKSIFIYGLVSLAVALSAGIMVKLITYILY